MAEPEGGGRAQSRAAGRVGRASARARLRRRVAGPRAAALAVSAPMRNRTPPRFPGTGVPDREPRPDGGPGSLLDTVRLGIALLDTGGRIVLWSPAAEDLLGWQSEKLAGRGVEELLEPEAARRAPEVVAEVLGGGTWRGVVRVRTDSGPLLAVEVRLSLLTPGEGRPYVLLSFAEAAALRAVERDLAVRDALFDQSPLGIAILDRDLRYARVNETLARMNGMTADEHVGRTTGEALPQRAADEVSAVERQVLATGEPVIDLTVAAPDPHSQGFRSLSLSRLTDRAGRVLGVTATLMDVTDRYRAVARLERARQRLSLLNEVGSRIGDLLDVARVARELAVALVPRFADYTGVLLLEEVVNGGELPRHPHARSARLLMLGTAAFRASSRADTMFASDEPITLSEDSVYARVLATGRPEQLDSPTALAESAGTEDARVQAALDLGVHSLLVAPLRARGVVLGLLVAHRAGRREAFDRDETTFAVEIADRAGSSLDNARLYARERAAALMLQRALLPQQVPQPPGVEVAYRYVPGSSGTEVGGDWFDVIALPRERTALVVGDVMGHGLRAAATMGRLRTAVRTLAGLDLPPAVLLQHVHDLADDLAQGPDEVLIATCVYAVYDPATRRLQLAKAGHTPPLLIEPGPGAATSGPLPGGSGRLLDLPSGAPLGVGGVPFESVEATVPEGALLVLYTDGLVESRADDIDVGTDRLRAVLEGPHASIEEACEAVVGTLQQGHEPDDVAFLLARLSGCPRHRTAAWTLPAEPSAVARARRLLRGTLCEWRLEGAADTAELLTSELVTNAVRYATAPVGLRLLVGEDGALVVEVSDPLPDPPRERSPYGTDEGGRGLQLVRRLAGAWGTRPEGAGKVVWFALACG